MYFSQNSDIYSARNFFRVKLKKVRSALQHSNIIDREEVYAFQWQAKVFSRAEVEYYSRETNCVADFEKEYHDRLKNVQEPGRLFNYVDQDDYCKVEEVRNGFFLCKYISRNFSAVLSWRLNVIFSISAASVFYCIIKFITFSKIVFS